MCQDFKILFKILRLICLKIAQDYYYTFIDSRDKLFKMAMKINPPDFNRSKSYERYKHELLGWCVVMEIPKAKQRVAIALSLPDNHESDIRENIFDELTLEKLKADDGFDTSVKFLDEKLGKDDPAGSLEKFEDFEDFRREEGQSVNYYTSKFDQKYNRILNKNMKLPSEMWAFKLLRRANITKE